MLNVVAHSIMTDLMLGCSMMSSAGIAIRLMVSRMLVVGGGLLFLLCACWVNRMVILMMSLSFMNSDGCNWKPLLMWIYACVLFTVVLMMNIVSSLSRLMM